MSDVPSNPPPDQTQDEIEAALRAANEAAGDAVAPTESATHDAAPEQAEPSPATADVAASAGDSTASGDAGSSAEEEEADIGATTATPQGESQPSTQADIDAVLAEAGFTDFGGVVNDSKLDVGRTGGEAGGPRDARAGGRQAPQSELEEPEGSMPLELPDFGAISPGPAMEKGMELLGDVDLHVTVELGRAQMSIEEVLKLGSGAVVELDKLAGDPVDILVNDRLIARGEVLILNDNFCVRVSEILAGVDAEEGVEV